MQFYALRIIVDRALSITIVERSTIRTRYFTISKVLFWHGFVDCATCQIYRRQYTLRRANIHTVHLMFTAALIHVHHAYLSGDGEVQRSATRYLEICSQALSELGLAYKNARRALEVIICIKADLFRCRQVTELNDCAGGDIDRSNTTAGWQFLNQQTQSLLAYSISKGLSSYIERLLIHLKIGLIHSR